MTEGPTGAHDPDFTHSSADSHTTSRYLPSHVLHAPARAFTRFTPPRTRRYCPLFLCPAYGLPFCRVDLPRYVCGPRLPGLPTTPTTRHLHTRTLVTFTTTLPLPVLPARVTLTTFCHAHGACGYLDVGYAFTPHTPLLLPNTGSHYAHPTYTHYTQFIAGLRSYFGLVLVTSRLVAFWFLGLLHTYTRVPHFSLGLGCIAAPRLVARGTLFAAVSFALLHLVLRLLLRAHAPTHLYALCLHRLLPHILVLTAVRSHITGSGCCTGLPAPAPRSTLRGIPTTLRSSAGLRSRTALDSALLLLDSRSHCSALTLRFRSGSFRLRYTLVLLVPTITFGSGLPDLIIPHRTGSHTSRTHTLPPFTATTPLPARPLDSALLPRFTFTCLFHHLAPHSLHTHTHHLAHCPLSLPLRFLGSLRLPAAHTLRTRFCRLHTFAYGYTPHCDFALYLHTGSLRLRSLTPHTRTLPHAPASWIAFPHVHLGSRLVCG